MKRSLPTLCLILLLAFLSGCANAGKTTVVWVSIDGLRGDFVERAKAPFLMKLMREGAYTRELRTVFPTITFTSHASEVTGVPVAGPNGGHGIPGNDLYDVPTKTKHAFPTDDGLLKAESIWRLATRQGIRVEVFDWPFSQMQKGPNSAAYFDPNKYDSRLTDEQRVTRWVETYEKDQPRAGEPPLRLVMGYVPAIDKAGHRYGPNAKEVDAELLKTDTLLAGAFDRFKSAWGKNKNPGDVLIFLVTTDHGMSQVTHLANLQLLLGITDPAQAVLVTDGPVGNVFLPDSPTKEQTITTMLDRLKGFANLKAYRRAELPQHWWYNDKDRVGDIVVLLDKGWTYSSRPSKPQMTVDEANKDSQDRAARGDGEYRAAPLGMHGYPADLPEMDGFMAIWRSDAANAGNAGKNLGPIEALRIHATVAKWLNIQPAKAAAPPFDQ